LSAVLSRFAIRNVRLKCQISIAVGKVPTGVTFCSTVYMTCQAPRSFICMAPHHSVPIQTRAFTSVIPYRTMAEALRKVSLNYDWTIKRAQNDLNYNIITPLPQSQPTSPSFPDTKPVEFSTLPCDVSVRFSVSDGEGYI